MHNKVDRQAGRHLCAGGQAGRYNYYPSFVFFSCMVYGIIKSYILCCARRKESEEE